MSMFFMVYFPFYNTKIQIIFQPHNFYLNYYIYMYKITEDYEKNVNI